MALHLNLLHELDSAKRARQRDPLKLGLYALVGVIILFLAFYVMRLGSTAKVTSAKNSLVAEWSTLEPKQKEAAAKATELQTQIALSENMVKYIESRFYWAPLLERIGELVPSSAQVNRISAELLNANECTVTIEGAAAGEEPRTVAEELRTALASKLLAGKAGTVDAVFVSLEDGTTAVQVNGVTLPTAVFGIRISIVLPKETAAN